VTPPGTQATRWATNFTSQPPAFSSAGLRGATILLRRDFPPIMTSCHQRHSCRSSLHSSSRPRCGAQFAAVVSSATIPQGGSQPPSAPMSYFRRPAIPTRSVYSQREEDVQRPRFSLSRPADAPRQPATVLTSSAAASDLCEESSATPPIGDPSRRFSPTTNSHAARRIPLRCAFRLHSNPQLRRRIRLTLAKSNIVSFPRNAISEELTQAPTPRALPAVASTYLDATRLLPNCSLPKSPYERRPAPPAFIPKATSGFTPS